MAMKLRPINTLSRRDFLIQTGRVASTGLLATLGSNGHTLAQQVDEQTATSGEPTYDLSLLYDVSTLEYWGERYKRTTLKILDEVVWPVLLSTEKQKLHGKPHLTFPLLAEGEARGNPLAFYVPAQKDRIVFPVFSLKFFDDLCTAYAWLQLNKYSLETVSEYTAILRYGKPSQKGFPPPLKALGIPENALSNKQVDELALAHFVTARTFILLHEMGHILDNRQPHTYPEAVRNEQAADKFAAMVMQRTPLQPLGILLFFLADAHWSNFPASDYDTHPLSGQRVAALATYIDDPTLANELRKLGALLDDPDIRKGFIATGKAGDLTALHPRRVGELPQPQTDLPKQKCGTLFDGIYQGKFVQLPEPGAMSIATSLVRRGDHVTGFFSFGLGIGTIKGTIQGKQLYFAWEWAKNYGKGIFQAQTDGSFTGSWGYREAPSGAGTWTGTCATEIK